jgi:hypothetical protein
MEILEHFIASHKQQPRLQSAESCASYRAYLRLETASRSCRIYPCDPSPVGERNEAGDHARAVQISAIAHGGGGMSMWAILPPLRHSVNGTLNLFAARYSHWMWHGYGSRGQQSWLRRGSAKMKICILQVAHKRSQRANQTLICEHRARVFRASVLGPKRTAYRRRA